MLTFWDTITTCGISPEVLFATLFSVKNRFCISFSATSRKALAIVPFMLCIE